MKRSMNRQNDRKKEEAKTEREEVDKERMKKTHIIKEDKYDETTTNKEIEIKR